MYIAHCHSYQPRTLAGIVPSPDTLTNMERSMVSAALFGAPNVSSFVDFQAFRDGMSVAVLPMANLEGVSFVNVRPRASAHNVRPQLFVWRARDYVARLCNQRLEDVEWLLSKLVFSSPLNRKKIDEAAATSDEVSQDYIDVTFESAFEDRVRFYLVQPGHPDHDEVKAMVGAERFQREREDPVLRARLFLQTIHGCDLVPMDPDIQFTVGVSSHLPLREDTQTRRTVCIPTHWLPRARASQRRRTSARSCEFYVIRPHAVEPATSLT